MAFLSTKASKAAAGGSGTGGYLSVSKLGDGEFYKVAIVSPNPLEFWEVWGEDDAGTKKPFRFTEEPSAEEIKAELGDFRQRMNYEQTALEAPKFVIAFFVYDYADEKIKVFSVPAKDCDPRNRQTFARRGLWQPPRLGSQVQAATD